MSMHIITLTEEDIYDLKKIYSPLVFKNECDLIYESHIPNTSIVLLKGELKLIKKKRVFGTLPFGSMIGFYNLIHNTPLKLGVKVTKDSSVLLIEKSQIIKSIAEKSGIIYQLISTTL